MRYLFGDSTEFPVQKNFLELLDSFVDVAVKTIELENNVYDLKDNIKDRNILNNSISHDVDNFFSTVDGTISNIVEKSKDRETIVVCAEKSKDILKKIIDDSKTRLSTEISQEIFQLEKKINDINEENRKILESLFLQDSIPMVDKNYDFKITEEGYSIKIKADHEGDVSSVFESKIDGFIKVSDIIRGVEIPIKMKKSFLRKELRPQTINTDDYFIGNVSLSERETDITIRERLDTSSGQFRLKMNTIDDTSIEVYYTEEDGTEENIGETPELYSALDIDRLHKLGEKLIEQIDNADTKSLETIYLQGKDVFRENQVFELMSKIAEILSPIILEIRTHSPFDEELSLKEEDDSGNRKEMYIKKSQIREKFSNIKEKGDTLLEILKI